MKKKSNGTFRARLNARGYEQVDGEHYDGDSISSRVANEVSIRVVLTLMVMGSWYAEILDVKGAFLHGEFEDEESIYMKKPEGFEHIYSAGMVLLLLKTIYGLKQAAKAFWTRLLIAFAQMYFKRNAADPCIYYKWTKHGLVIWVSWIDDLLNTGK